MAVTRIEVCAQPHSHGGQARLRTSPGLLRAQRLHGAGSACRVALVATTAMLLGGDDVEVQIRVASGARLALQDVAGTVAYAGRGRAASWRTRIVVEAEAELSYAGEPFVVAGGADVTRALTVDAAADARVLIRETLVLGRDGEIGGPVRDRLHVRRDGADVLIEDQELDPGTRHRPGRLGVHRVIDTLLALGADEGPLVAPATRFRLLGGGSVTRFLGAQLADSPLRAPALRA